MQPTKLKHIFFMLVCFALVITFKTAAYSKENHGHDVSPEQQFPLKEMEQEKRDGIPEPHDVEPVLPKILKKQNEFSSNLIYLKNAQTDLIQGEPEWFRWRVSSAIRGTSALFGRPISTTEFQGTPNRSDSFNVWTIPPKQVPANTRVTLVFAAAAEGLKNPAAIESPVSRAVIVSCGEVQSEQNYWKEIIPLTEKMNLYEYSFYLPKTETQRFRILFQINRVEGNVKIGEVHLFYDETMERARVKLRPEEIEHRIDVYRKANLHISVVDKSNKPVPNATVSVEQKRHEFLFGTTLYDLSPSDKSARQTNYQNQFLQLFNWGGLTTFLNQMYTPEGKPKYDRIYEQLKWYKDHNIEPFANQLVETDNPPEWLKKPRSDISSVLRTSVSDTVKTFSPEVPTFVVASELIKAVRNDDQKDAISTWVRSVPRRSHNMDDRPMNALEHILTWARNNAAPKKETKFIYNMFEPQYISLYMNYKETFGYSPDAVGISRWIPTGQYEDLANLWKSCDECKDLNKPLPVYAMRIAVLNGKITHGSKAIERSNLVGEKAQADYLVQISKVLFSHPSVRAIGYDVLRDWDEKYAEPRGLVRFDGTPKLAFYKLKDLIHKEWWTNVKGTTDSTGSFATKAFYGDYVVTVKDSSGHSINKPFKIYKDADRDKKLVITL